MAPEPKSTLMLPIWCRSQHNCWGLLRFVYSLAALARTKGGFDRRLPRRGTGGAHAGSDISVLYHAPCFRNFATSSCFVPRFAPTFRQEEAFSLDHRIMAEMGRQNCDRPISEDPNWRALDKNVVPRDPSQFDEESIRSGTRRPNSFASAGRAGILTNLIIQTLHTSNKYS
jgi:hypothetical protein